jgi:nucleotide-binding universal stress UspA family protein
MFKYILAPATGYATDAPVFQTALLAAKPFGAHLEFLHAKLDVTDVIVAMSSGGMDGGGTAMQGTIDGLETDAKAQEQKAWQGFSAFCTAAAIPTSGGEPGAGLSASMSVETGDEAQWLADYGRYADLIVTGRKRGERDVALDVLEAALMDTDRPLLIAPTTPPASLTDKVVIAWKDTKQATRAIFAALPLIEAAREVVILSVAEADGAKDESCGRLLGALRWHNKTTTVKHLERGNSEPVDVMLAAATALGATLLVMGGYSHSRMREIVFGGFTQRILNDAPFPVLLAH